MDPKTYFFKGEHNNFLKNVDSLDLTNHPQGAELLAYKIGALCFLGRVEEAEILFQSPTDELPLSIQVQCRFFLSVAWGRLSDYDKARALVIKNLSDRHSLKSDHQSLFFLHQGLAFFRFTCCQYYNAQIAIDRSFRAAVLSKNEWQLALALDLKGYIYRMRGNRSKAISALESALAVVKKLGNGVIKHTLGLSLCTFRAPSGRPLKSRGRAISDWVSCSSGS